MANESIGDKLGSFLQDIKELGSQFSWSNLKIFFRQHWIKIVIILSIFIVIFYIVSKIFELMVKLAIAIFVVWLLWMLIFNRPWLKEKWKSFREGGKKSTAEIKDD